MSGMMMDNRDVLLDRYRSRIEELQGQMPEIESLEREIKYLKAKNAEYRHLLIGGLVEDVDEDTELGPLKERNL